MSRPAQIRFLSTTASLYDPVVAVLGFGRLWETMGRLATAAAAGRPWLDVCTGTGGVAVALARRGGRVVGLDLSPGMLRRAARKARVARVHTRTGWVRMDARRLAFRDGAFAGVTCAMALHEMAEEERAVVLAEIRRVAAERVLVAEYRVPRRGWRRLLFGARNAFEYLESDDFSGFLRRDMPERLLSAGLLPDRCHDAGPYRIWSCRVPRP